MVIHSINGLTFKWTAEKNELYEMICHLERADVLMSYK